MRWSRMAYLTNGASLALIPTLIGVVLCDRASVALTATQVGLATLMLVGTLRIRLEHAP